MTRRVLTLVAVLALAGCATSSSRAETRSAPQGETILAEPRSSGSLELRLREGVVPGGTAQPECPMRIFPVQPGVAPMPEMRIDSTRRYTIRLIPPGCTPRPA